MSKNFLIPLAIIIGGVLVAGVMIVAGNSGGGADSGAVTGGNLRKAELEINGMFCSGCESAVEGAAGALPGVKRVDANPDTDSGTVVYDADKISAGEIVQAPIFETYPAKVIKDSVYKGGGGKQAKAEQRTFPPRIAKKVNQIARQGITLDPPDQRLLDTALQNENWQKAEQILNQYLN